MLPDNVAYTLSKMWENVFNGYTVIVYLIFVVGISCI